MVQQYVSKCSLLTRTLAKTLADARLGGGTGACNHRFGVFNFVNAPGVR